MKTLIILFLSLNLFAGQIIVVSTDYCGFCVKQKIYIENAFESNDMLEKNGYKYVYYTDEDVPDEYEAKFFPTIFLVNDNNETIAEFYGLTKIERIVEAVEFELAEKEDDSN